MPESEYYEEEDELPKNERLHAILPAYREPSESTSASSRASSPRDDKEDPGLPVLFASQFQLRTHLSTTQPSENQVIIERKTMVDQADDPPPVGRTAAAPDLPHEGTKQDEQGLNASVDSAVDLSAISEPPDRDSSSSAPRVLATRLRTDSMQADVLMAAKETQPAQIRLESPLKIRTTEPKVATSQSQQRRDSISTSPTLSKHVMPASDVHGENLAPFEPPSPSTSSPKVERLPSIQHITSSLTELAEAATQEIPRQQQGFSHHHSQSFGSAMSQSPVLSGHPYPASIQTSPQAYYPALVIGRSPTSTVGAESQYASPPVYLPYGAYSHPRASMTDGVPPVMPRLPTGSSSGDSYGGYPSPGTEGYSTNHTTPVDIMEHTPRPMLPPPPGMHTRPIPSPPIMIPGPYKCDVPNCTAGTFQTQYLLKYVRRSVHEELSPPANRPSLALTRTCTAKADRTTVQLQAALAPKAAKDSNARTR